MNLHAFVQALRDGGVSDTQIVDAIIASNTKEISDKREATKQRVTKHRLSKITCNDVTDVTVTSVTQNTPPFVPPL